MSVDIHRHERILSYLVTASARSPSVIAQREGLGARVRTGCLVRSLESAMNTRATNSEWRMRLVDLVQLYAKYGRLYGKVDQKHLESIVRQADQRLTTAFIERLSHQDSLMGEALRRNPVYRGSLPPSCVRAVSDEWGIWS